MPIYWYAQSIPQLQHASPAARRPVLAHRLAPQPFRHWQKWVPLCGCVGFAIVGAYAAGGVNLGFWGGAWIGAIVGAGVGGGILGQVKASLVRSYISAEFICLPQATLLPFAPVGSDNGDAEINPPLPRGASGN